MYVYIVTRIVKGEQPHVTSIPNLGVHTSRHSAIEHYKSVIKDRREHGRVTWSRECDTDFYRDEKYRVLSEAYCEEGNTHEFVRLEQWRVNE